MNFVYLITNLVNGKKYVGKTSRSILSRWKHHLYDASSRPRTYLHRAVCKYGANSFEIKEIDRTEDRDTVDYREMFWIAALKTYDKRYGYNLTFGGDGVWSTPETRLKISIAKTGSKQSFETKEKRASKLRGKKLSLEARKNIKAAWDRRRLAKGLPPLPFNMVKTEKIAKTKIHKEKIKTAAVLKIRKVKAPMSLETRAKIAAARRGKGYPHSEKTKQQMSVSKTGKLVPKIADAWIKRKENALKLGQSSLRTKAVLDRR